MTQYPEHDGLNTADEIIEALIDIAEKDNTTFEQVWRDGYTEKHNAEEVTELVKLHILKNVKIEDLEEYYNWGCCEKVWIIDIKKLFQWATAAWDYDAVDNWNTEEYELLETSEGYYKVHVLGKDDKHGLFLGKYTDSPEPLEDYEDREIHVNVYMKISKEEFNDLSESEEEE